MFNSMLIRREQNGRWFETKARMVTTSKILTLLVAFSFMANSLAKITNLAEQELNDLNALKKAGPANSSVASVARVRIETRQYPFVRSPPVITPPALHDCPLCDLSVYSYCSHKLIHDSCCCGYPGATIYQKPPQCVYYDCALLYAKSCYEHSLIKNCCCNNPY